MMEKVSPSIRKTGLSSLNPPVFLSFVIPVYNVEAYLDECLFSLLNQDYPNCEFIVVENGSDDKSASICDAYNGKPRFKIFHFKERIGLGPARNFGTKIARGDYIVFLDSDDWIDSDASVKIIEAIVKSESSDIIFFDYFEYKDGKDSKISFPITSGLVLDKSHAIDVFPAMSPMKIYRRAFFSAHPFKKQYHEDAEQFPRIVCGAQRMFYFDDAYYHYRRGRPGSILTIPHKERLRDLYFAQANGIALLWKNGLDSKVLLHLILSDYYWRFRTLSEKAQWRKMYFECNAKLKNAHTKNCAFQASKKMKIQLFLYFSMPRLYFAIMTALAGKNVA